jgi:hypothetical protein
MVAKNGKYHSPQIRPWALPISLRPHYVKQQVVVRKGGKMKLAEALAGRSDCQKRLEEIRNRLDRSSRIQEGEEPAENPDELLAETNRIYARLLELISAINRTNSRTAFDNERTISDVIAERDLIGKRRNLLSGVADSANSRWDRYSKSEVRFVMTVPVGKLRSEADQLAKQYRELDLRIQELNWKTELI